EPRNLTRKKQDDYAGPGLRSDSVPSSASRVTIRVIDQASSRLRSVALVGGLVGVTQDADGALRPIAGWHLEPATPAMAEVIERIVRDHQVSPPPVDQGPFAQTTGPAEIMSLFSRIGSATLFAGNRAWWIRPSQQHDAVALDRLITVSVHRII